jgi:hypothetical protein
VTKRGGSSEVKQAIAEGRPRVNERIEHLLVTKGETQNLNKNRDAYSPERLRLQGRSLYLLFPTSDPNFR